ncbi:MAG: carboxypeptidase-like regulatory domain-containing protein [Jatrophihabitantaceae bacterium]
MHHWQPRLVDVHARHVLTALATAALLAGCGQSPQGEFGGYVTGRVLSAPGCPVKQFARPCPPRPVAGAAVVAFYGKQQRDATTTDQNGGFSLFLLNGHYTIEATNPGPYASHTTAEVSVSYATVHVTLTVDSGIR